jgi:flagellar biosynthesis/type III secretory pathway M-ring protein FliF/YscJ
MFDTASIILISICLAFIIFGILATVRNKCQEVEEEKKEARKKARENARKKAAKERRRGWSD